MGITKLVAGKKFKLFMARLYGWGASLVIIGALFKIMHWEGAGAMLTVGLLTEAVIFFFSAFEPPHEDVDWSLVYPELAGMHDDTDKKKLKKIDPIAQELDKLLADAKIGPELIESLGSGFRKLGENTAKMSDMTDASVATSEYISNVKSASQTVGELTQSYSRASQAMIELSGVSDDAKIYADNIQNAGKNLAALNAVYELQLQESNTHLRESGKFYEGINELMRNLHESLDDTKRYKEEVSSLAKNLSSLNTVYGNMLSAMNSSKLV
jgi:gliding motility-associated protein GldL